MQIAETSNAIIEDVKNFNYAEFCTSLLFWAPLIVLVIYFVMCLFLSLSLNKKARHDNPMISPYRYGYFISIFFGLLSILSKLGIIGYLIIYEKLSAFKLPLDDPFELTIYIVFVILVLLDILVWILVYFRIHLGWVLLIAAQMIHLNIPCALINFLYYSRRTKNLNGSEFAK